MFVNDIHTIFGHNCVPININNWKINSLSFADDLVILSETAEGLENSLASLESYCNCWGLKVNATKTKVVVFNKRFNDKIKNLNFSIDGNKIELSKSYCYLGVEMSCSGSFQLAADSLRKKALRALHSIYSSIDIYSDAPNATLFLKLFDSLVKPVLLYGSEIWGDLALKSNNCVDKFVNKFYRILLGVPNKCSTIGSHVELGRFPVCNSIKKAMLKFWFRLVSLPKSRLVSHCYWSILENSNDKWLQSIRNSIYSSGQCFLWDNQHQIRECDPLQLSKYQDLIWRTEQDQFLSSATEKIKSEAKLHLFANAKDGLSISNYIKSLKNRQKRSVLCKLRMGVLDLEIELGRRAGTLRDQRFCKLCHLNIVEDEIHFTMECPALADCRSPGYNKLLSLNPKLNHLSNSDKVKYLFFNENTSIQEIDVASDMLLKLYKTRESLLSNITHRAV